MYKIFLLFGISLLVVSCNNSGKKSVQVDSLTNRIDSTISGQDVDDPLRDSILLVQTREIITAFKNFNYDSISRFIHPEEGVRFSPYSSISIKKDVLVKIEEVQAWKNKKKQAKIEWGSFDGNDKPINLTADEYVKRFVYDVNFLKVDSIKVNKFIGNGNTVNNLTEVYPGTSFVEYYYPGVDKKNGPHYWRSLRLVYKFKDGKYFLVGVVHDEWTI
jgi:hypothetical protein